MGARRLGTSTVRIGGICVVLDVILRALTFPGLASSCRVACYSATIRRLLLVALETPMADFTPKGVIAVGEAEDLPPKLAGVRLVSLANGHVYRHL